MGEVDVAVLCDRAAEARYRGRGAQGRSEPKEPRAFHGGICVESGSAKPASAVAGAL
jgi:hypothetical protein